MTTNWTREAAIAVLEECERTNSVPWTRKAWDAAHQEPSSHVLKNLFGSWTEAWRTVAGPLSRRGNQWTSTRVLSRLQTVGKQYGRWLTISEWNQKRFVPTSSVVLKVLGSWRDAWRQAGYDVPVWNKSKSPRGTWSAERILEVLRDNARADGTIMGRVDWSQKGHVPNLRTIYHYWGSYGHAVEAARLTVVTDHQHQRHQEQAQWLQAWDALSTTLGRAPTKQEWNAWPDRPVTAEVMAKLVHFSSAGQVHRSNLAALNLDYVFPERNRTWIEEYLKGRTPAAIGTEYHVTRSLVQRVVKNAVRSSRRQFHAAEQVLSEATQLELDTISDPITARLIQDLQGGVPIPLIVKQTGWAPTKMLALIRSERRAAAKLEKISQRESLLEEVAHLSPQCVAEIDALPIARLGFPTRVDRALSKAQIASVGALRATGCEELLRIPHFGTKCLEEVQIALGALGVELPVDPDVLSSRFVKTHSTDAVDALPIVTLGLSIRTYHCLRRGHINTVGVLRRTSPGDLLRIRTFGKKCLQEVTSTLARLHLVSSDPSTIAIAPHPIDTRLVSSVLFSVRVKNCLARAHITTLGTLRRTSDADLLGIPNFGPGCLREVRTVLHRMERETLDLQPLVSASRE